jgi:hypothetical protein
LMSAFDNTGPVEVFRITDMGASILSQQFVGLEVIVDWQKVTASDGLDAYEAVYSYKGIFFTLSKASYKGAPYEYQLSVTN